MNEAILRAATTILNELVREELARDGKSITDFELVARPDGTSWRFCLEPMRPASPDPAPPTIDITTSGPRVNKGVQADPLRRYLTVAALARHLGKSRKTIHEWDERGLLPARVMVGPRRVWFRPTIEEWERERGDAPRRKR